MTTTTNSIGPNSVAINYSVNSTRAEVLDAVEAYIITKGWDLYDSDAHNGQANNDARAYRALCADGTSYKYVVVWLTSTYLMFRVYEDWNATTHTGTNLASYSDNTSYAQQLTLNYSGYVYIFATPRWLLGLSRLNTGTIGSPSYSTWCGCMEISKDNPDEIAGDAPIYAWVNGCGVVGVNNNGSYPSCFSLPRTITNRVTTAARYSNTVVTMCGATQPSSPLVNQLPITTNPLSNNNELYVFTPFAVESHYNSGAFHIRGRFYGLKIMSNNLGSSLDKISVKTDVDGFYSPEGAATDHHILVTSYGNSRCAIPS